jgi:hypothetical protein
MKRVLFIAAVFACGAVPAFAQEPGSIGVVMGYPASFGVQWHVSERVAIRPEFKFSHTTGESDSSTLKTSSWSTSYGLGALFYTSTDGSLRTYVSPQFLYLRGTADTEGGGVSESEQAGNAYQFTGAFGAQYGLGSRFTVFAEVGLSYAHTTSEYRSDTSSFSGKSSNDSITTTSRVGVTLYFK